jgi:uncharacterized protein (DUF1697 family)
MGIRATVMPIYIALLRGINVGPHKRMKMEQLRDSCRAVGFREVKTYIQSGNIVFAGTRRSPAAVSKKIADVIARDFGFSADVITRTHEEMKQIIDRNPLLKENGVDLSKLHVVFLSREPSAASLQQLQKLTLPPDRARASGREIYFYFPNGVSGSSLWKHPLDRVFSVSCTMRNWKTINELYQMAREIG